MFLIYLYRLQKVFTKKYSLLISQKANRSYGSQTGFVQQRFVHLKQHKRKCFGIITIVSTILKMRNGNFPHTQEEIKPLSFLFTASISIITIHATTRSHSFYPINHLNQICIWESLTCRSGPTDAWLPQNSCKKKKCVMYIFLAK